MISQTSNRVSLNTSDESNEHIRRQTAMHVAYFAQHPELIDARLHELDDEWDIERTLETGSSALSLLGLSMSVLRGRRWIVLPILVQGFFLQHALQGWCPPLPLLRKLGFRTADEINAERYALRALRGDFGDKPTFQDVLRAVEDRL
jgi:hypothetical protein